MKHPLPIVLLTASVFVAGCSTLENPFGNWFGTGRDARVYNAQTGEYEWPTDSANPRARNPAAGPAGGAAPAPERRGDGRYYDAARNEWVQAPAENVAPPRPKSRTAIATPAPLPPPVTAPPPPPPSRASGIYNPSTGQIEWSSYDPAPRSAPAPAPRKKWWWPF